MNDGGNQMSLLWQLIRKLVKIKLDDARVVVSIKATTLLASIVYLFVLFMLALCLLAFVACAGAHWLSTVMSPGWAYMTIAAAYLLLIVVFIGGKRSIVVDPIARFVSKLLIEKPHDDEKQ